MLVIRYATSRDIPAMLDIYAPYVRNTAVTFEYELPSAEVFAGRFAAVTTLFPWLAAEENGTVAGYAYGSAPFERAAYQWNAELSVYISPAHHRRGLAVAFYHCLETLLARQGYVKAHALLTASNAPSLRLHAALGYTEEGRLLRVGYKLGAWHDVVWLGKALRDPEAAALCPPIPWQALDPTHCTALFRSEATRVKATDATFCSWSSHL